jgi:hypothetical protein
MSQFGRPVQDLFNNGWVRQNGDSINTYQSVDDVVQDDADYVQSGLNPNSQVIVFRLTGSLVDPGVDTGHWFRIAGKKNTPGGRIIDMLLELRQGYIDELNQGTLIGGHTFLDVQEAPGGAFGLYETEVLESTIANITDYTDLSVRLVATVRP